jgi:hypothetical protein
MADVSDAGIRKALARLLSDRGPTDWLSVSYAEGSADKFVLAASGSGGLAELASYLAPSFQGYAYVRIGPDTHPGPSKFVLIRYVGEECTAFQKAKVIVHEDDIVAVFQQANLQIAASTPADLSPQKIAAALNSKR